MKEEQSEQPKVTPAEYFSAAYKDASGYLTLCAITQPAISFFPRETDS